MEGGEVLDFEDLADVSLKVGADVFLEPDFGLYGAVVNGREEACVEKIIDGGGGATDGGEFGVGEGKEVEECGATGEALGDGLDGGELTGSGENEATHAAIRIYETLDVGKESGGTLNFVEDGSVFCLGEKGAGVFCGEGEGIGVFEREVGELGREKLGESRFPRLARSGDGEDWETFEAALGGREDASRDRSGWDCRTHCD